MKLPYLDDPTMFTAVALPFGAGGMEMVFILPKTSYTTGEVAENIAIPKFHLKAVLDLIPTLPTRASNPN